MLNETDIIYREVFPANCGNLEVTAFPHVILLGVDAKGISLNLHLTLEDSRKLVDALNRNLAAIRNLVTNAAIDTDQDRYHDICDEPQYRYQVES